MECNSSLSLSLSLTHQNHGLKMNSKKAGEEILSEIFTWLIENFSKLQTGKHYSDVTIAGFKWRLLIWPKGNKVKSEMQFSMYLCAPNASTLEPGWARSAHFSLSVVNQLDSSKTITKATKGLKQGIWSEFLESLIHAKKNLNLKVDQVQAQPQGKNIPNLWCVRVHVSYILENLILIKLCFIWCVTVHGNFVQYYLI
ncbi:MATH domain and coiled-coil domain-containing protein At3g58270-like [Pyrus x bretschneideri]|uniref:MATH domain and coiled-coil domain-containing protein At3g58270-like n=1 Tax=Pyrus x bretschneideri TaxID=225117 RepID=UPI00202FCB38|nr:MATH domain and coiled-coil domain-containing protein At3g58270-like [Pyrus x bretschneideri]